MSNITIQNLTFSYPGSYDPVFENVSFCIDTDWKLGFTGRNGRGKTTFLRLLMGEFSYQGTISSSVGFGYFPYTLPNEQDITLFALQAMDETFEDWMLIRELSKLGVDADVLYRPYATLSGGEQTKVLMAALFLRENRFLLIDEPTNHLDTDGRAAIARYLNSKKGFILVSHDRTLLDACTDHTLSINKTNIEIQHGNFSSWMENKERQDAFEQAENERLKKDIRKLEAAARQSRAWADKVESTKIGYMPDREKYGGFGGRDYIGEQSRRMQQRRKNLERRQENAIAEKSALLKNIEEAETLKLSPLRYHSSLFAECKDLSLFYGDTPVVSHVQLTLRQGDRLSLSGINGSGKSTILKLLCGENMRYTGTFHRAAGLIISYVAQNASTLSGSLDDYARSYHIDIPLFRAILRKLDFSRIQFEKPMESYSAGQKKKVMLARSLCERAHLYIWDEPLNYIDIFSRMQIESLILTYQPTMLFVEHDHTFCEHTATSSCVLPTLNCRGETAAVSSPSQS